MSTQFRCIQGHSWSHGEGGHDPCTAPACPVCGSAAAPFHQDGSAVTDRDTSAFPNDATAREDDLTSGSTEPSGGWSGEDPSTDRIAHDLSVDEIPPFREAALPSRVLPSTDGSGRARLSQAEVQPPALPGYEILRELGRGGMGAVYLARQNRLNRLVAVKVVLEGAQAPPEIRARFVAEAEAVARLQHPNIVQVFEFGEDRGTPFLVLEYVSGQPLSKAGADGPQSPPQAARLVETLAWAVEFAHERGIVHRDLKPSNVLLTPNGEPKIADFGLAKNLARDATKTLSGTVVGTPNYMAPEQAAGNTRAIGPATDVYALGAILYWLLVGRPPFHAESVMEILRQVVEHEAPGVRVLNPRLPKDLDTICTKCLQKDSRKRYASAAELADDLERYLRGEPIRARPVGRPERFARWCRRNPGMAALATALVFVFMTGFSAVLWQWRQTVQQQAAAEEHLQWATAAVSDLFTTVSEETLLDEPGLQPLRRDLLQRALAYYEMFAEGRSENPDLQQQLAQAHLNIGKIHDALGEKDLALAALNEAVKMLEALVARQRDSAAYRWELATAYARLAELKESMGDLSSAAALYDSACGLLGTLRGSQPENVDLALDLADHLADRAYLRIKAGDFTAGSAGFREALAVHEELARDEPDNRRVRTHRAATLNNWALAQRRMGQVDAACQSQEAALAIEERLLKDFPHVLEFQQDIAQSHFNLGSLYVVLGKYRDAQASFASAREAYGRLREGNPQVLHFQQGYADCLSEIAYLDAQDRRFHEATEALEEAVGILERLTAQAPASLSLQNSLRNAYNFLGMCLYKQDDPLGALKNMQKAADMQEAIAVKNPELPEVVDGRADMLNNLGLLQRELGELEPALKLLDEAIQIKASLAERYPDAGDYHSAVARIHVSRAECFLATGDADRAIAAYRAAEKVWQGLIERDPSRWQDRDALASALTDLAEVQSRLGSHAEARQSYRSAVELLAALVQESSDAAHRFDLACAWHNSGELERRLGDDAAAMDHLASAGAIFQKIADEHPDDPLYVMSLITNHRLLGEMVAESGDFASAADWYTTVIDRAGPLVENGTADEETLGSFKHALLGRAAALESLGREAEAALDRAQAAALGGVEEEAEQGK